MEDQKSNKIVALLLLGIISLSILYLAIVGSTEGKMEFSEIAISLVVSVILLISTILLTRLMSKIFLGGNVSNKEIDFSKADREDELDFLIKDAMDRDEYSEVIKYQREKYDI